MNTHAKLLVGLVALVIIAGAFFFFASSDGPSLNEPVKIGVMAPLSDLFAFYGEEIRRGVTSVHTDGIEFIVEDTKCGPTDAINAFRKLTEFDDVQFIIGVGYCSSEEAVAPLLAGKEVLAIVPSAASSNLHEISGGNFFNMQYALENESKFIAEQMLALGYDEVVLISYQNDFSRVHVESFLKHYKGEVVKDIRFLALGGDVSTELAKLRNLNFDAVFSTDAQFFFDSGSLKLKQLGINVPIFSQYATELPALRELVEGVIYSFPDGIAEGEEAVFGLSREASELLTKTVRICSGDYTCVKKAFEDSGAFDEQGTSVRSLILRQIVDGEAVLFTN